MVREFEEWSEDDFCFPWLDCISTNQFRKLNIILRAIA